MSVQFRFRVKGSQIYQFHIKGGQAYEGDATQICEIAIQSGVQQKYLVVATNELYKCQHDYADFDETGKLLYTRKEKW